MGRDRFLRIDENLTPAKADDREEIFPNGIFEFNITKMLAFIHDHPDEFVSERITVKDFPTEFSSMNEDYMNWVTNSEPVVLAELAPGRFNLIDGHHRVEKARRSGKKYILAYRVAAQRHAQFLPSREGYVAYVEYWNGKMRDSSV